MTQYALYRQHVAGPEDNFLGDHNDIKSGGSKRNHGYQTADPLIVRSILQRYALPRFPGWESRIVLLDYAPGAAAPVHNHPVVGLRYVLEDTVVSEYEDGNIETYTAGEGFMDLTETVHVQAKNPSATDRLKCLVSYVIPVGEPNVKSFHTN